MKNILKLLIIVFIISCNNRNENQTETQTTSVKANEEIFNSVKGANGKYSVDKITGEYLHRLENTVINFKVMAKKRKPGVEIYKEFSEILMRELQNLNENFYLKGEGQTTLQKILENITEQNKTLAGNDLEKTKTAFKNVCELTEKINEGFDYNN